jgi:hypothetical protein
MAAKKKTSKKKTVKKKTAKKKAVKKKTAAKSRKPANNKIPKKSPKKKVASKPRIRKRKKPPKSEAAPLTGRTSEYDSILSQEISKKISENLGPITKAITDKARLIMSQKGIQSALNWLETINKNLAPAKEKLVEKIDTILEKAYEATPQIQKSTAEAVSAIKEKLEPVKETAKSGIQSLSEKIDAFIHRREEEEKDKPD